MPSFQTNHGLMTVDSWGYQLQGLNGNPLDPIPFATSGHGLVVIDPTRNGHNATAHTVAEINAIENKPGGAVTSAYVSIGEVNDFRDDWNKAWTKNGHANSPLTSQAPSWMGPVNPDWPEGRNVRYWDPDWQNHIFNNAGTGALDRIVAQGFDSAYLDIVDAYYFWAAQLPAAQRRAGDPALNDEKDAAQRMIDFIVDMTAHARLTNPDFFVIPQNGGLILDALEDTDPVRKAAYLNAIGAIAIEDMYLRNGTADENNGFQPDTYLIHALQRDFLANGKPVFAVDYVTDIYKMGLFIERAQSDGFIPYVARDRDLDRISSPVTNAAGVSTHADIVAGTGADDSLVSLGGNDILFGFGGNDTLAGGTANDTLSGGRGHDILTGGTGRDIFDFNVRAESGRSAMSRDVITDFERGIDKIDVMTLDANSRKPGNQDFIWIGSQSFHKEAGELRYQKTAGGLVLSADINGDGRPDFQLQIVHLHGFGPGDVIL